MSFVVAVLIGVAIAALFLMLVGLVVWLASGTRMDRAMNRGMARYFDAVAARAKAARERDVDGEPGGAR